MAGFDILALFGIVFFVSLFIAIGIAWFTYRWYARLPKRAKYLLLAVLIVGGALLLEVGIGELMVILGAVFWLRDNLGR